MASFSQLVDNVVVNTFELQPAQTRIGRRADNDIRIDEISVSGHHAVIEAVPNVYLEGTVDFYITDSDSTNGTFVNDIRVESRQRLNSNDVVRVGWNEFRFVDEDENALEKTAYILD
ncbi:FHA domain-containing protein [Marinobacter qingdaonensis]|jgi:pSer/pThr/pTyr-binding forkhead associated (FHA) protein|uniref:FHA domain-containing protein n=1 Tax=Marinobacter qingdaonensis TaxID=3108486 RepID=A0ABU5NU60_9GAMM|nr:FHA domain-containing protein [Marinobacter sp. ASW11-75]MEA1079324.1 FHA domain-containing protein [Marinobacter sp. ASW11-75]MEE3116921.1 FHA domain-containing protein [Pseudomonadota bacterium]